MYPLSTHHLRQIFNELDTNKDGLVSIQELMSLLQRLGLHPSRAELELLVGDKALDFFGFLFFYKSLINEGAENKDEANGEFLESDLRKAFRVFDLNGDGFICCEELGIALGRLGLLEKCCGEDCVKMIGVYDANSDGVLDFEEFKEMMMFRDSLESS